MPRERSAFTLFKRGKQFYARFWSDAEQRYTSTRATGQTNKAQAGRVAQQMIDRGEVVPRSRDLLLTDYLQGYWEKPPGQMSERYRAEMAGFVSRVRDWPEIRNLRLSKTTRAALYRLQDWLSEQYTPRSVQRRMLAVTIPLREAYRRDKILVNPCDGLKPVQFTGKERGALSAREVAALIALPWEPRERAIVLIPALAGLRRGEVRALRWEHVDLEHGVLHVTENVVDDVTKEPKAGSRRTVMVHPVLADMLQDLREASPYDEPADYVIPNVDRLKPVSPTTIRRVFSRAMDAIGLDDVVRRKRNINYHGLRRTFVTHARQALPDYAVQAQAGHSTARMTKETYSDTKIMDLESYREKFAGMYAEKPENEVAFHKST